MNSLVSPTIKKLRNNRVGYMNSITARWMMYVQIVFLVLSFWVFLFITPAKAEPLLNDDASTAALVVVASLQNQHGPVEYRPADPQKLAHKNMQQKHTYTTAQLKAMARAKRDYNERKMASYSGNLWAMYAKP